MTTVRFNAVPGLVDMFPVAAIDKARIFHEQPSTLDGDFGGNRTGILSGG